MFYKYRVTLEGIKGFYRVYAIDGANSLYRFHKQLRADLEFPADQQILFKSFDEGGNVVARYALMDIGCGTVDNISIADTVKAGITKFVYFYDVVSKKSVTITFEGEATDLKKTVSGPEIIDTKGPVPLAFEQGYVAYEDLPDEKRHLPGEKKRGDKDDEDFEEEDEEEDDDDEEEEEEEEEEADKEEEEIIYDANE